MVALVCSSAASRSMVLLSSELIAFFSHRPEPVQRLLCFTALPFLTARRVSLL
jgi:hypothetical protein